LDVFYIMKEGFRNLNFQNKQVQASGPAACDEEARIPIDAHYPQT